MSIQEIRHLPAIEALVNEIKGRRDGYNLITNTESDITKIYRAQGAIEALDTLSDFINAEDREIIENEPDQLPC